MSKLDKILNFARIGASVGGLLAKGKAKSVLDIVNRGIADKGDPANEAPLRALGEVVDALTEVARDHESRIARLELAGRK